MLAPSEQSRSLLSDDQCVIHTKGEHHFFVRGCLDIPIVGEGRSFTWGVWVSLSEQSMKEVVTNWEEASRINLGPYFGWLCNRLPEYPDTMFLKTTVHVRPIGERPYIQLEETDHPLSVDQRDGIAATRMQEIISSVLHRVD